MVQWSRTTICDTGALACICACAACVGHSTQVIGTVPPKMCVCAYEAAAAGLTVWEAALAVGLLSVRCMLPQVRRG